MFRWIKSFLCPSESYRYRVIRRLGGWEPQMSFTAGRVDGVVWYPLTAEGYWLEPDAFTDGNPKRHITMARSEAKRAVLRARAINGRHISVASRPPSLNSPYVPKMQVSIVHCDQCSSPQTSGFMLSNGGRKLCWECWRREQHP